jgi:hypothetical protein
MLFFLIHSSDQFSPSLIPLWSTDSPPPPLLSLDNIASPTPGQSAPCTPHLTRAESTDSLWEDLMKDDFVSSQEHRAPLTPAQQVILQELESVPFLNFLQDMKVQIKDFRQRRNNLSLGLVLSKENTKNHYPLYQRQIEKLGGEIQQFWAEIMLIACQHKLSNTIEWLKTKYYLTVYFIHFFQKGESHLLRPYFTNEEINRKLARASGNCAESVVSNTSYQRSATPFPE